MAAVNKVILIGNLGNDPEVKHLEGDNVVAKVSLATTESYKDKQGNKVDQTEWHDLELWGQQAKIAEQYLKKGSQIYVEGKIKTDKWTDDQGNNRKAVKIRVLSFTMLGGRPQQENAPNDPSPTHNQQPHQSTQQPQQSQQAPPMDQAEDDLPF